MPLLGGVQNEQVPLQQLQQLHAALLSLGQVHAQLMAQQVAGAPKKKEVYAILQHVTKMVKMRRLKDGEEWGDFKYQDLPVILHSPMPESLSGLILQS